ncbi:MAG: EAL domain-containing protein [Lachnospiraceae bacterium]
MHIQSQCCAFVLLLYLFFMTKRQKKVGLYTEKLFFNTLILTMVSVCLDIFSIIALVYVDFLPHLFVTGLCRLYLISLCWMGFQAFVYTCLDAFSRERYKQNIRLALIAMFIFCGIIGFLPIDLHTDGFNAHTSGLAVRAAFLIAFLLICATLYMLIHEKANMNAKRRTIITIWLEIWTTAIILQIIAMDLRVIGFASALCMTLLFFELENPEAYFDRETGLYNGHTLIKYLNQKYENHQTFSALLLTLPPTQISHSSDSSTDYALDEVVRYLETLPYAKIFKNVEQEFFLSFYTEEEMMHDFALIQQAFQTKWAASPSHADEVLFEPNYLLLPDSSVAADADELLWLLHYFNIHSSGLPSNHVVTIDENVVTQKRLHEEMEHLIISALEEDRVEVFYQPIYSTEHKKFVSAEALVRIRDRDGSIIPPGLFISIAEETGLIAQIGETVFEKTCHFIKKEDIRQYGIEYIEVNLSVTQCERRNLASIYKGIMNDYHVDPSCINLEITESASLMAKNILLENMRILIDYGVSFSLDDFGNGQSNLNYIVDMPVSIVKFDKDMTHSYFDNAKAKSVLSATNDMIHKMNLKVVSEGVETREQLDEMISIGIDYIQGFYFSCPLPQDEFLEFIKNQQPL